MSQSSQDDASPQLRRRRIKKRITESSNVDDQTVRYKKRRKKRRVAEKAPVEVPQRALWTRFWIVMGLIVGLFITALGLSYTLAYHNSGTFKKKLESEIEQRSQAEVEISKLRLRAQQAEASRIAFDWVDRFPYLQRLQLEQLTANYTGSGFLGSSWGGAQLESAEGHLFLNSSHKGSTSVGKSQLNPSLTKGFEGVRCFELDLSLDEKLLLKGSRARFSMVDGRTVLSLAGGRLKTEREVTLDQGVVEIEKDHMRIDARFAFADQGMLNVKTRCNYDSDESIYADIEMENLSTQILLGEEFQQIFDARWSGKMGHLTVPNRTSGDFFYEIPVSAESVVLGEFECFKVLSEVLTKSWYVRPTVKSVASMGLKKLPAGDVEISMKMEETGRLSLKGKMRCDAETGNVKGELQIGVPQIYSEAIREHFGVQAFVDVERGYVWQTVVLSGKIGAIKDDLSSKKIDLY